MILGLGTDVIAVARVRSLCEGASSGFTERWFTHEELAYCRAKAHPARHLAARLAAKESVVKALRLGLDRAVPYGDIEVVLDQAGAPSIRLHGALAHEVPRAASWHLSLSHCDEYATAVAVLEAGTAESPGTGGTVLSPQVRESIAEYARHPHAVGHDPALETLRAAIMLEDVANVVLTDDDINSLSLSDEQAMVRLLIARGERP